MSIIKVNNQQDLNILDNACICFGVFDGIHKGHLFEIDNCIQDAKNNNTNAVCITFDIDPDELFVKDFRKILSNKERIEGLSKTGVDYVLIVDFSIIQNMESIDFLDWAFGKYTPKSIHVGQGFRFGKNASGNEKVLKSWAANHNMRVCIHDLLKENGQVISSSNIRKKLSSQSTDK